MIIQLDAKSAVAALGTGLLLTLCIAATSRPARQTLSEYKVITESVGDLEASLNKAASDGWRVVTASSFSGIGNHAFAVVEREKR